MKIRFTTRVSFHPTSLLEYIGKIAFPRYILHTVDYRVDILASLINNSSFSNFCFNNYRHIFSESIKIFVKLSLNLIRFKNCKLLSDYSSDLLKKRKEKKIWNFETCNFTRYTIKISP